MSICVAVTDSKEGRAALEAAADEAALLNVGLVVVNLSGGELDPTAIPTDLPTEVVVPALAARDEVEEVLQVVEDRPEVTRLVVGVRNRSPLGKVVLGSIAQRLILESSIPVLAVKAAD